MNKRQENSTEHRRGRHVLRAWERAKVQKKRVNSQCFYLRGGDGDGGQQHRRMRTGGFFRRVSPLCFSPNLNPLFLAAAWLRFLCHSFLSSPKHPPFLCFFFGSFALFPFQSVPLIFFLLARQLSPLLILVRRLFLTLSFLTLSRG